MITVKDPASGKKTINTTGFTENSSHSGEDSARSIKYELQRLATLAGVSADEIAEMIDFIMTDRASDNNVMFDKLNLPNAEKLHCNAHVVLGIHNAIEKVFKETESSIGVEKLIDC